MTFRMRSGALWLLPVILLAGALLTGCGDDNGGGEPHVITVADFEGPWMATLYRVTSADEPGTSMELISLGGAFGFDVNEAGEVAGRGFVPASVAGVTLELPVYGTLEVVSQDTISADFEPEIPPFLTDTRFAFTLDGDNLDLYAPDAEFDFDGDLEMEPAIFEGTMIKLDGPIPIVFTADFEGHWEMTSYTLTSVATPAMSVDIIALGATLEFDVDEAGQAVGNAFIPEALAGTDIVLSDFDASYELVKQDTVYFVFEPEYPPFLTNTLGAFTLDGDVLTISDDDFTFDFGQGAGEEAATFEGTLERMTP
jgi:hypothetical protein